VSTGAAELLQDAGGTITDSAVEGPAEIAARSPIQLFWRRLRQDKVALAALGFIVLLVLVAIFAPLIVKLFDARPPAVQDPDLFADLADPADAGPHWTEFPILGTDNLGRDVFSRTLYGARV
jgi:ABC-type dipeptide/oligopeptide/nickel transport system permease subunit